MLEQTCRSVFAYFYEKVYKQACPSAILYGDKANECLQGFAERLDDHNNPGSTFVYDYVLYQFGRYYEKIQKKILGGPTGRITLLMVFGAKPHEVYDNRRRDREFMITHSPLLTELNVSKEELSSKKGVNFTEKKINVSRTYCDPTKKIASEGPEPLETCIDINDLYSPTDPSCQECTDKEKCKVKLKELYPRIYKSKNL